jgi:hypothetical protein
LRRGWKTCRRTDLLGISVRSVASASAILDKADPAVVKAVEQGRVTVSCASEIIKLNLDSEDTSELMTLPKGDISRNVERLKKEAKRKEAFERMTPQELEAFADPDTSDADNRCHRRGGQLPEGYARPEAALNPVRGARTEGLGRVAWGEPAARGGDAGMNE